MLYLCGDNIVTIKHGLDSTSKYINHVLIYTIQITYASALFDLHVEVVYAHTLETVDEVDTSDEVRSQTVVK